MKEQLLKALASVKEFWAAQDKKKRIMFFAVLGGIVAAAVVMVMVLNYKDYVVLYSGLEATQAATVYSAIQEMGVDVKMQGNDIVVPKDQQAKLLMELSVQGYPQDSLNYDVYNNNVDMFTTDSEKREQSRMQLETRLIASIKTLECVDDAIVTLSIPEQQNTVIATNSQPSSASVILTLKNNSRLSNAQVQGITSLIAAAVPGLLEENVTITDSTGSLVTADGGSYDDVALERNKLKFKQDYQNVIRYEIEELLIPSYGENGAKVAVNAELNYDKQLQENTEYTPSHQDGSGMVQHEDHTNASGTSGTGGDVVGVEPNADDTYPTGTAGDTGAYSDSSSSTSYLVNTFKTQIEKQGFAVDDITVSVIIYKASMTDTERDGWINLAANAAGCEPSHVTVANVPKLEDTLPVIEANFPFGWTRIRFFVFMATLLALIIVFVFLYVYVSGKAKRKRRMLERRAYAMAQAAGESGQVDGFFNLENPGEPINVTKLTGDVADTKEAAVRREIESFSKTNPEIVAQLLKSWIREEMDNGSKSGGSASSGRRK